MTTPSKLVQSHRKKAGLTQAQLARLAGVGKTVVWDLENGKESVQWDTLQKIFRVFNITIEWRSPLLERTSALSAVPAPSAAIPRASSSAEVPPGNFASSISESRPPV